MKEFIQELISDHRVVVIAAWFVVWMIIITVCCIHVAITEHKRN